MDSNGPKNRRVTISELKRTNKALKKALRKETRRRAELARMFQENDELHTQVNRMRNERNFPFEPG
jgi:hypothetical protein